MAHGNQKVSDEQILQKFEQADAPYLTATELAERLPMSRQGLHERLMDLYESGAIERKKTGRTVGWWIAKNPVEE